MKNVCKKGIHHNTWITRKSGTRYCLPCLEFAEAVRDYKRLGYLGSKRLSVIEKELDFQVSLVENQIAELVGQIVELRNEKIQFRNYYEKRIEERKKAK